MRIHPLAGIFMTATLAASPAGAQSRLDSDESFNLICSGDGTKMSSKSVDTYEWDRYDDRYRVRSGTEYGNENFQSTVTIQIYGNDGRIRLPPAMIPPINSGGDHQHWWQLRNLSVTRDAVEGEYKVNGIVSPKVMIDRTTGDITIKGWTTKFSGTCQKVDAGERRF